MFERLRERFARKRTPPSAREPAEEESIRREAEQTRQRAEAETAEQAQRIGGNGTGSFGGW